MTSLRFVERLRDLTGDVDVVLSDIWGVVHNGLESFPEACEALHKFRQQGGTVILINTRTLLLILSVVFSCSVQAREIAGVHIDETVAVPGVAETLKLNGTAIRTKIFIKVYVAALYVTETSGNSNTLLASISAKRMMMHMLYNEVEKEKLVKAWQEGFEKNLTAAEFVAIKPRLERFNNLFSTMRKHDVALIDYVPGVGTRVTLRGEERGVIEGADFYRAVLSVWIGDKPATDDMKAGLLGLGK